MKNIEETRNYFIKEIDQNDLISNMHKKFCTALNYIENFLILVFAVTGSISISGFASFLGILIEITTYAIALKICVITAGIKKWKSIIKKKEMKYNQIILLAKTKLNS